MQLSEIAVESMAHLLSGSQFESEHNGETHHTQRNTKAIKLILYFWSPAPDQPNKALPRLSSVRVPKGTPIFRLRSAIKYLETELTKIYGPSKRANFVSVSDEDLEDWEISYELPLTGVSYV